MREEWSVHNLGDIATMYMGRTPSRSNSDYWTPELKYPFCTIADMDGPSISPSREGVTERAINDGKARVAPTGSLLMSFKLTIGRVGFAARDVYPNEAIVVIEPDEQKATREFLYYRLGSMDLTGGSGRAVKGSTLNSSSLAEIRLNIPSLAVQHRIVDLMSSVDSYIAALQQQADAARVARSAVLSELLSAGGEDRTQIAIHDMVELSRERVDPRFIDASTMLQHWSIPALDEVGGPIYESAAAIGSHKFRVRRNAVVYSLLNPRIPRYALIDGGEDVVCSTEFAVMYPKSIILDTFLLVLVSSTLFQETVASSAMGTTKSRERVRPGDFESISLTLPPLVEQKRIVSIMSSIDGVIQSTERAVVEVKRLRSGLLSELLSGNHEIPESYDRLLGAA